MSDRDRPNRSGEEDTSPDISLPDDSSQPMDFRGDDLGDTVEVLDPFEQLASDDVADELAKARADADARLDDARRLKAEFENYKKRVMRDQASMVERASGALVERLLPVLDSFRLALIAADRTKDYEALVRGVELVYGELRDVMHKEGLEEIESDGKPFDPEIHEAVMEAEGGTPGGEPYVADVLRTGYRLKGRVLRPTMVKVERR